MLHWQILGWILLQLWEKFIKAVNNKGFLWLL